MRLCDVEGCGRKHYARGYCNAHWQRLLSYNGVQPHIPIGGAVVWEPNPTIIPVGWVPPDAGKPMPFSLNLRRLLASLELDDADMDAYSRERYDMACDADGRWTITPKPATVERAAA